MGVHGLWRLIEPSGKPVPLETLENKTLAVDVSIWLHQAVKGFQDSKGAPVPNAHLLGLYHRICKLLYFRVRPVFVFDGGVPVLKKETIAKRNQQKSRNISQADVIRQKLLDSLLKHSAISKVLSEKAKAAITSTSPTKKAPAKDEEDDLYFLPPGQDAVASSSDEDPGGSPDDESSSSHHNSKHWDLHSIDTNSAHFKSLPVEVRHEILTDLKETRKQSSWGRINELPVESDDFSVFQMNRLLKRQSVQTALEEAEKEMGGHSLSLGELEKLLKDQGVIASKDIGKRIASDENTRFFLIKDVKQAIDSAKKITELSTLEEEPESIPQSTSPIPENPPSTSSAEPSTSSVARNKADEEFEDDLKMAIALSIQETPSTSKAAEEEDDELFHENFTQSESSDEEVEIVNKFSSAQSYMLEYSGLTPNEIAKIIAGKNQNRVLQANKVSKNKVTKSIEKVAKPVQAKREAEVIVSEEAKKKTDPVEVGSTTIEIEHIDDRITNLDSIAVDSRKTGTENEVVTTTTTTTTTATIEADEVKEISDSDSGDDFMEVEDESKTSSGPVMEVVIKPDDEQIEDDLFSDVFGEEKQEETETSTPEVRDTEKSFEIDEEDKSIQSLKSKIDKSLEDVKKTQASPTKASSLRDNVQRMINEYSRTSREADSSKLSVEQMEEMKSNLRLEQAELTTAKVSKERLAGNITDQMYQEAQELLELFGVPFLIAPMEAEAQCAFLDEIKLTDGTITDDSDIWLFGGRTVYKNFFNQTKTVMEFRAESIHHHFKLNREQMILLALLVGSDYTMGITGVGPVTALEILAAFPPKTTNQIVSGLAEFHTWFQKGQQPGPGRTALRSKLKNVTFHDHFPSFNVVQAYLEPKVETSKEAFSWARPNVPALIAFAKDKFGWTKAKTEEILTPVINRLKETRVQASIKDYFKTEFKADSNEAETKMSKRVRTAVRKIGNPAQDDKEDEPKPKRKRTVKKKDEEIEILKKTAAKSKKRVKEIEQEAQSQLVQQEQAEAPIKKLPDLHKREVIPQKQKDKAEMLRSKMKAIEVFRKSKQGPGYMKKTGRLKKAPKEDAGLSESSSDDE